MAKKKEVVITCNATNVKAVIEGLERGMAALAKEEENLLNVIKQRGYAENDEKKRLKELEKAMDAMRTNVQKNREEQKKLAEVMKDLSGAKLKDLKKALQEGKNALNNMSERDPKRKQLVDDLKRIEAQINKNTGATNKLTTSQKGFSSAIASTAKNLATYMIGFAGFNKVKGLVEDVFKSNLKLSDSLANIRKVSGLSMEAINELYRNISQIDSRNTIETLNQLAYTGAKLGIGQNYGVSGLTGFVKAAEQVQMALGEDMGEKALPDLSKMVEVMGLIPKYGVEQSMQKAASAIFQLGATSTATGTNIVEFSKRLYGLANVSRISTQDLLGLASASDAMGLMPEVSATAFNKLFTSIQRQHNLIEQSLGMTKGRIKELYDEGKTMDAIVEIFERMNQKGNLNLLGNIFKDLGSDGARLVNVMATMADRADMLSKHLKVSRDAFKEGEAVIGEYMIQNQTAAALVERASNLWAKAFVNPEGVDMVKEMAQAWYDLSKQMTQSEALMGSLHTSIELIAGAISTLIKLFPVLIRFGIIFATTFGFKGLIAGIGGLVTAFRTLYKDIALATGAMGKFNVMMKSNAILFAISSLITAITLFNDYSKAAEEAAKREAERQAKLKAAFEGSKEAVENVVKPLERYKRILEEGNLSEKQKLEVIKELNGKYQEYLDYLGIEIKSADDLAKAYAKVVDIMKIKKAYEERESFRQQKNGDNRMSRIENQAKVEAAARSFGLTDVDKQFLEKNQRLGTNELYRQLIEKKMGAKAVRQDDEDVTFIYIDDKLVNAGTQFGPRAKKQYKKVGSEELYNAINDYISSFRSERNTNKEIDAMFDSEYSWTDKNGKKRKLSEFDIDEYNDIVQKAVYKRKGSLDNEKPDKDALAAAKKAAQERKKALKLEMDEAQKASTGIISKIEEYYRLQEATINEARADGQLTEEQAKEMVRALSIVKNESLATARRAVTTGETKNWDELKTKVLPAVMSDTSDVSRNLLSTIQQVAVDKLHADLEKFNGSSDVLGLDSRAFFDLMNAKAAGNTREAARLRAKIQNEVEKALLQYQFVEKANLQMRKDLEAIGITTETYEQWAKRMQQGITEKPAVQLGMRSEQREQMYRSFEAYGEQTKGPKDAEGQYSTADKDVVRWVQQWSQQADNAWMKGLPQLDEWLSDTDKYEKQIADFYRTLLSMYDGYKKQIQQSGEEGADFLAFTQGQQQVSDATAQLDKMFGRSITDKEAYREMGNKFVDMGVINFRYNIENQQEAEQWLNDFATTSAGELEDWTQAFPELVAWIDLIKRKEQGETLGEVELQTLQNAMPAIRNLFNEMMRHADRLDKAMKDAFQHEKETQESRFRVSGYKDQEEQTDKFYANKAKQEQTGAGQTFVQQIGLGSIANDPEILQIQNRIYWRNKEVEDARARLDEMKAMQQERIDMLRENGATEDEIHALEMQNQQDRAGLEQLLMDRQAALTKQTTALTTKTMQELQKRVTAVQNLTKPFSDAAKNIGQKFGEMIRDAEEDSMTWEEIWHNMLIAVGESVIQMSAQYAQNLIMQQAMNRASEAETAAHTTAEVTAGIAAGSAKTIGTLGWWGIPLVAVISALLMGLLQGALSTNRSSKSSETSTKAAATPKTKLVSGMLTYDQGNVDKFAGRRKLYDDGETQVYDRRRYLGEDGKVYTATAEPAPKDGLVTHPIATTVQGQPALVAEKGPEIVIGRETTANIMRNAPELLQAIVDIDRNPQKKPDTLPTYDKGNVSEVVGTGSVVQTDNENKEGHIQEVTMRVNRDNRYHTERSKDIQDEQLTVVMNEESLQQMLAQFRKTRSNHEATDKRLRQMDNTESLTRWFRDFATAEMTTQYVTLGEWAKTPESHIGEIKQLYKVLSSHDEQTRRSDQQAIERTMDTINNVKDITSVKAESENTVVSEEVLSKMTAKFRTIEEQRRLDTNDTAAVTRWLNDFVTTDVTSLEDVRSQKEDVTKKLDVSSKKSDVQNTSTVSHQTSDIKNREVRESFTKAMPHIDEWLQEPEKHQQEIVQLYTTLTNIDERERISREESRRHSAERFTRENSRKENIILAEQYYKGEDGRIYKAQPGAVPEGVSVMTQPIATAINGQPALVAENGPEIVIGRETTKAIMMNEPELIRYLANYQQGGRRLFDSGNVQSVAGTQPSALSPQPSDSAERQALINRLDRSDALMEQVLYFLQNPVAPEIAMYDTGGKKGLRTKMKEADRFMARYDG